MATQQWEYLARSLKKATGKALEKDLNVQGLEGWELVSVGGGQAVFKRPVARTPAPRQKRPPRAPAQSS